MCSGKGRQVSQPVIVSFGEDAIIDSKLCNILIQHAAFGYPRLVFKDFIGSERKASLSMPTNDQSLLAVA